MLKITVRAPLHATEDADKVRRAILNLLPEATLETREREIVGDGGSLDHLATLIKDHQIPDSARSAMLRGRRGNVTRFRLAKQAAFVNHPSFGASADATGPLGDIEIRLESDEEDELYRAVYETAPDTTCEPEWATVPPKSRPVGFHSREARGQDPNADS